MNGAAASPALERSFRDPAGTLLHRDNRIFRIVSRSGLASLEAFLASRTAAVRTAAGDIVRTRTLSPGEISDFLCTPELSLLYREQDGACVLEHERVWFPAPPHEWPAPMLAAAAALTLDLALAALDDGLCLKDATPLNVLFRGPRPVFVDILSFERRDPLDPIWLAQAQFCRTFLLPLAAHKHLGLDPAAILLSRRDGIEPEDLLRCLSPLARFHPSLFSLVTLPAWLGRRAASAANLYRGHLCSEAGRARFVLERMLRGLQRRCHALDPPGRASRWSGYMNAAASYTPLQLAAKQRFAQEAIAQFQPRSVLDAGCNTGHYSILAAASGARVVAIDSDSTVVGELWRRASRENLDILPLVVNLARPTPGVGWRNLESPSFLRRAEGQFDFVLMLALVHHLLVTERVPLDELIRLVSDLTTRVALVEYVGPADPMFQRLVRGRDPLYQHLTHELFEARLRPAFETVRVLPLPDSHRRLYLLRKRA